MARNRRRLRRRIRRNIKRRMGGGGMGRGGMGRVSNPMPRHGGSPYEGALPGTIEDMPWGEPTGNTGAPQGYGGMAGGNMGAPMSYGGGPGMGAPMSYGNEGTMVDGGGGQQFQQPGFDPYDPQGFGDYAKAGGDFFDGNPNQYRPPGVDPQGAVDLTPYEPGGGGGGGPGYLGLDQHWVPKKQHSAGWRKGGYGGVSDFGPSRQSGRRSWYGGKPSLAGKAGKRQRRRERRQARRMGADLPPGISMPMEASRGDRRQMRRQARRMNRRMDKGGFDFESMMENPIMRQAAFDQMGGLGSMLGHMYQGDPDSAMDITNQWMERPRRGWQMRGYGGGGN